jgi:hypothetical protein
MTAKTTYFESESKWYFELSKKDLKEEFGPFNSYQEAVDAEEKFWEIAAEYVDRERVKIAKQFIRDWYATE